MPRNLDVIFIGGEPSLEEQAKAAHNQAIVHQYDQELQTEGVLTSIFAGGLQPDDGVKQFQQAAGRLAGINPKLAVDFMNKASEARRRATLDARDELKDGQEKRMRGVASLGSANPQSYRDAMHAYATETGEVPSWYTANFEKDKPHIEQLLGSTLTTLQQVERQQKGVDQQIHFEDLIEKRNFHEKEVQKWDSENKLREEKQKALEDYRKENLSQKDRALAARQNGKLAKDSIVNDKETAAMVTFMKERPEFGDIAPKAVPAIAQTIASQVRHAINQGDRRAPDEIAQDVMDELFPTLVQGPSTLFGLRSGKKGLSHETGAEKPAPKESQSVAKPSSKADYDSLPSGSLFIAPDGSTRRKP